MSVINIEHISKLYGDRMVLEDLSATWMPVIRSESSE